MTKENFNDTTLVIVSKHFPVLSERMAFRAFVYNKIQRVHPCLFEIIFWKEKGIEKTQKEFIRILRSPKKPQKIIIFGSSFASDEFQMIDNRIVKEIPTAKKICVVDEKDEENYIERFFKK